MRWVRTGVGEAAAPAARVVLVRARRRVPEAGLDAAAHVVHDREVHLLELAVGVAEVDVADGLVPRGQVAARGLFARSLLALLEEYNPDDVSNNNRADHCWHSRKNATQTCQRG